MERIARSGGLISLFKIIQYIPYIVIGLLVVMVVFWVIFGTKKLKWAKTLAIILTILVVISSLLIFTPYIMGAIIGKDIPLSGFFSNKDSPRSGKEQFRDYRDRMKDKQEDKKEELDKQEKKESGLDIETNFQFVEVNGEFITL